MIVMIFKDAFVKHPQSKSTIRKTVNVVSITDVMWAVRDIITMVEIKGYGTYSVETYLEFSTVV